ISRDDPLVPILPDSPERRAADAAIECINCAVCYSACDVVAWDQDYLGPAALNRAWAALNDVRDGDRAGLLRAVSGDAGCGNCHSHQSCADHCPVEINPTRSIAGLKRASLVALLKGNG
ncbi:MAG: 4Fe-4S dicluster domain-containing protein, partial [Alphaproteobacteria bacterium]|nr:4Fe-4S dicluster domain-containing protein [Alphaproteobacteria bacterium]